MKQLSIKICISRLSAALKFFLPNNSSSVITEIQHSFPSRCLPTCSFPPKRYTRGLVSATSLVPLTSLPFLVGQCVFTPFYFAQVFFRTDYLGGLPVAEFFLNLLWGYATFQRNRHMLDYDFKGNKIDFHFFVSPTGNSTLSPHTYLLNHCQLCQMAASRSLGLVIPWPKPLYTINSLGTFLSRRPCTSS